MASLIDTLIDVLEKENSEYEEVFRLSMEETGKIVDRDLDGLADVVERIQLVVERINVLEKKRAEATDDIACVLSKDASTLTLDKLSGLLSKQKSEQAKIDAIHDKLKNTLSNVQRVNESNQALLNESLEMVQFEMNLVQSLRNAPQTANYSGTGYADDAPGYGGSGSFDAKQ